MTMGQSNNLKQIHYDTPEDYIKLQPIERQAGLERLSQTIKKHLPVGFQETIQYGTIGFVVPHTLYPKGYHVNQKEPLPFIALANQKGYIAFYHLGIYVDKSLLNWFIKSYEEYLLTIKLIQAHRVYGFLMSKVSAQYAF